MITSLPGSGDAQPSMPASTGYRMVEATLDKQVAAFRNGGPVKNEIDYFRSAIAKVDNPDDLVKDYRLFRFVLSAYGLDSQINAQALMKKVLSEDWTDTQSIANKLVDPHYREIAKAFDFHFEGDAKLQKADFLDGVVDRYVTTEFEKSTENTNPGVRLALYFKRMAPDRSPSRRAICPAWRSGFSFSSAIGHRLPLLRVLLRLLGRLPPTDGAAPSGGRRPRSLNKSKRCLTQISHVSPAPAVIRRLVGGRQLGETF